MIYLETIAVFLSCLLSESLDDFFFFIGLKSRLQFEMFQFIQFRIKTSEYYASPYSLQDISQKHW